jgi:hypothetical protein
MSENPPFVAVIGGFWNTNADTAAAKAKAKVLGAELAKAGFGLVTYFSNEESLEPHVVSGYVEQITKGKNKKSRKMIRVRYAEPQRTQVVFREQSDWPDLFDTDVFRGHDWEAPFYRSLAQDDDNNRVDAALFVAGAKSTLIAGQIAIARGLPILAIDEFSGAAASIWRQIKQPSSQTRTAEQLVEGLKDACVTAAEKRTTARFNEQLIAAIKSQRHQAKYGVGVFLLLLAVLVVGIGYVPSYLPYALVMFPGLILAGATGALIRASYWQSKENEPWITLFFGAVAGLFVGFAYLIPLWIANSDVLKAAPADSVTTANKVQFLSVVLISFFAGVGFDAVFDRFKQQARNLVVGLHHHGSR